MTRKVKASKGRSASECTTSTTEVECFKPLFNDLFLEAKYTTVDPHSCIPFVKIRQTSKSGVQRLIYLFDHTRSQPEGFHSTGLALGSGTPIVVSLDGALQCHVYDYFRDEGLEGDELDAAVAKRAVWFGIIDGEHSNLAVRWLVENNESWKNYSWFVTLLSGGHSVDRYRQLSRFQNHRHSPRYNIRLTLFDELNNLKSEYSRLALGDRKPSNTAVAQSYFGTVNVSRTMTMLASTAVRLPKPVIQTVGHIMNSEHPDLCTGEPDFENHGATTQRDALSWVDCRVYRSFIRLQSLYGSTMYMNPKCELDEKAQVNTLYRVQNLCRSNGFRTVQHTDVSAQFKAAVLALKEEVKFLKYIDDSTWPSGMETIQKNLLRSMILDDEVSSNQGNEFMVIESLRSALRRVDPELLDTCDERLQSRTELKLSEESNDRTESDVAAVPAHDCEKQGCVDTLSTPDETLVQKEATLQEIEQNKLQKDIERLSSRGITFFNKTWQDYCKVDRDSEAEQVHLIITEPPSCPSRSFVHSIRANCDVSSELDEKELSEFSSFCKDMLLPGGYVIIFLPFYGYSEWYQSFHKLGFDVMNYPYVVMFDSNSIQNRNTTVFPQNSALYAMLCHLPGPVKHKKFNSPFHLVNCSNHRNLAGMFNVKHTKSPLRRPGSKVVFNSHELPVDMLCELIDLFCPHRGRVMDPYCGTMTTLIAAIRTGRHCVGVEKASDVFSAALHRLRGFLPATIARDTRPQEATGEVCSTKFEEGLYTNDNDAHLLLNISTQPSPVGESLQDAETGQDKRTNDHEDASNENTTENDMQNNRSAVTHGCKHLDNEAEKTNGQEEMEERRPEENENISPALRRSSRSSRKRQAINNESVADQPGQVMHLPLKRNRVGLVRTFCHSVAENVNLPSITHKLWK